MITIPYLTSPKLADSIVQALRIDFATYIHWLTYVYPTARIGNDEGETYPMVSISDESYRITPDTDEDAYCFFKQSEVTIGNDYNPNRYDLSVVCWAQIAEVGTLTTEDETMTLANDFIVRLRENEAFDMSIDLDDPFRDYTGVHYDNGTIMRRRTAFRIDFSIYGDNDDCPTSYDQTYGHYGTKSSAVDKGKLGQVSYDDDYWYICVQAGSAGNATWKKFPIVKT